MQCKPDLDNINSIRLDVLGVIHRGYWGLFTFVLGVVHRGYWGLFTFVLGVVHRGYWRLFTFVLGLFTGGIRGCSQGVLRVVHILRNIFRINTR